MCNSRKSICVGFVFDNEDNVIGVKIDSLPYPFSGEMITNMIEALKSDKYLSALKDVKRIIGKYDSSVIGVTKI